MHTQIRILAHSAKFCCYVSVIPAELSEVYKATRYRDRLKYHDAQYERFLLHLQRTPCAVAVTYSCIWNNLHVEQLTRTKFYCEYTYVYIH